jgi:hypothetical protein
VAARWGSQQVEAGVLVAAGAAVLAWWVALATSPRVRRWFELDDDTPEVLSAFVIADLLVVAVGAIVAGTAVARSWPRRVLLVGITFGGWAYVTLYVLGWVVLGGDGLLDLVLMVPPTVAIGVVALRQSRAAPA